MDRISIGGNRRAANDVSSVTTPQLRVRFVHLFPDAFAGGGCGDTYPAEKAKNENGLGQNLGRFLEMPATLVDH
jgi:hypothetical protein